MPLSVRILATLVACGGAPAVDSGAETSTVDPNVTPATNCPVPSMQDQFPGEGQVPNPYTEVWPNADACVATHHDVIIVLGCPNNADGTAADCQTKRADIAIALSHQGYGDRFITSGAAAHNAWVEADTLKQLLVDRGVDATAIVEDTLALHTDENLYYSTQLMVAQGWTDALVVSDDPGHLVMTAVSDSNCCVDLGRLSLFTFDLGDGASALVGHYALYPWAEPVTADECAYIAKKLMSIELASRHACKANFQLDTR